MDTETFGLLKDQLARYVEERLIPAEDAVEEADDIPPDIVSEFKAMACLACRCRKNLVVLA
jgi:acyl-CoA dehydrogenase